MIQLLIEADVIEVPPPNHISNKSEGVVLDNCDLIYYCVCARIRFTPRFIVVYALIFERPTFLLVLVICEAAS